MAARLTATFLRTQTDRRLIALARQGSEPAFEALVERYRRPLQAYCRRMLLPGDAAEDVVQQAFLSTWQALERGTDVQDASAWLYRVTHNAALNALRRSGYDHAQLDDALHGAGAPEEDLERRIAVRQTLAGLASLPELQREALLRTAVEGQSHEHVARALGLTDGAVRGLVYRARATLRTAATALTPAPVAHWAAFAGSSPNAPLTERVAEIVAGGGTVGASALLAKGGATLIAAGTLAGGALVVEKETGERRANRDGARVEQQVAAVQGAEPAAPLGADGATPARRGGLGLASLEAGERRRSGRDDHDDRDDRDTGRSGARDDDRSDSSGPGSGREDDDDDERSGSSGSGSDSDGDDDRSGSSGPGSGSDDDSSGSGSGGQDDSSGPGSSGSGSDDSSGSGSGSDDSSGSSGSGDSAGSEPDSSGSGPGGDSSGSGSDSSGSGSGSSGSGSGSGGSGGDDSSGSGSGGGDDDALAPVVTTPDEG